MVTSEAADDIDVYPPLVDFKSKALSNSERSLFARDESSTLEAFPVQIKSPRSSLGGLLRCVYEEPAERATGMCIALSSMGGPFLAYGLRNGNISIFRLPIAPPTNSSISRLPAVFNLKPHGAAHGRNGGTASNQQVVNDPITSVSWLHTPGHSASLQNVLACTQGATVSLHHATTSKLLDSFTPPAESAGSATAAAEGLLASSASRTAGVIAVGGTEGSILILDCNGSRIQQRESLQVPAAHAGALGQAHASRVFTVRWHPDDPNTLISGGWDKFVKVWDLRTGRPSRTIPGPLLCGGTSAAVAPGTATLATASWRLQDPLQLWDLRTGRLLTNLPLSLDGSSDSEPPVDVAKARQSAGGGTRSTGGAAGGAGNSGGGPGVHMHGLRAYSVAWLAPDVLACGGSGVRHGLRVVKTDGTAVACAACPTVHDVVPFVYADRSTAVAAGCAGGLALLPPLLKTGLTSVA